MAKRRRKNTDSGELLMFSFDEMLGDKPTEQSALPAKTEAATDEEPMPCPSGDSLLNYDSERMTEEMVAALHQIEGLDTNRMRLLAMESATLWHSGIKLSGRYKISSFPDMSLDGYQLTAFYYCCFYRAFPEMTEKMYHYYDSCYEEAYRRYSDDMKWKNY